MLSHPHNDTALSTSETHWDAAGWDPAAAPILCPSDDAMDGGAQQSCVRDPPEVGSVEQEGDVGEGPPATDLRRSQPLFIHSTRWVRGAQPCGVGWAGGQTGGSAHLCPTAGHCQRRSRVPHHCPTSPTPSLSSAALPTRQSSAAPPVGRDPPVKAPVM